MSITNETKMVHRARHITELAAREKNKIERQEIKNIDEKN